MNLAKTPGSELAAQSETKAPQFKKVARTAFAAVISAGLVGTFALPAYANLSNESNVPAVANQAPQVLTTVETEGLAVQARSEERRVGKEYSKPSTTYMYTELV